MQGWHSDVVLRKAARTFTQVPRARVLMHVFRAIGGHLRALHKCNRMPARGADGAADRREVAHTIQIHNKQHWWPSE